MSRRLDFYYAEPFRRGGFMVDYVLDGKVLKTEKVENRYYELKEIDERANNIL